MESLSSAKLLRNLLSNYTVGAIAGVSVIVLTRVLFQHLGAERYAAYALAAATAAALEALDSALSETLLRYLSEHRAHQQLQAAPRLASTMFWFMLIVGAVLTGLFLVCARWVVPHLATPAMAAMAMPAIMIMSAATVFQFGSAGLRAYLIAFEDFRLAAAVESGYLLLTLGATLVVAYRGGSLTQVAAVWPAVALVRLGSYLAVMRSASIPFVPRPAMCDFRLLRRMRTFSLLAFVEDGARRLYLQTDMFIAARALPVVDVATLSLARRLPNAFSNLPSYALQVAYPRLVAAHVRGEGQNTRKFVAISGRNILALFLPLVVVLWVWAEVLLRTWIGPEAIPAVPILRWLLVCGILRAVYDGALTMAYGAADLKLSTGVVLAMLFAVIVIGTLATRRAELFGLAATLVGVQLLGTVGLVYRVMRVTRMSGWYWLRHAIVPLLPPLLLSGGWLVISKRFLPPTFAAMALSSLVAWVLFAATFVVMATGFRWSPWRVRFRVLLVGHE